MYAGAAPDAARRGRPGGGRVAGHRRRRGLRGRQAAAASSPRTVRHRRAAGPGRADPGPARGRRPAAVVAAAAWPAAGRPWRRARADLPLQYIDARDLAAFICDAAARRLTGAYNVVGPPGHTTMGELLETAAAVTGGRAELRWTDPSRSSPPGSSRGRTCRSGCRRAPTTTFMHRGDVVEGARRGLRLRRWRDRRRHVGVVADVPARRRSAPTARRWVSAPRWRRSC